MHSIDNRFVTGPSHILFGGVYVGTFQSGNFTGCGSEGVNQAVAYHWDDPQRKDRTGEGN